MIVKINKKTFLGLRNHTYIYTQFDAQNAGNSVSELPDFKFFRGGVPPDPPLPTLLKLAAYFKLY